MLFSFDAFGDDPEAQGQAHADDCLRNGVIAFVMRQAGDERSIDFQLVDWETFEIPHAGVTGAEVVDGYPDPQTGQGFQLGERFVEVLDQDRFGELQFQALRLEPGLIQGSGDVIDEGSALKLERGNVDGNHQIDPVRLPSGALFDGLVQYPLPERNNESGFFGDGDEVGRRHIPQFVA